MKDQPKSQTDAERVLLARQIRAAGIPIFIAEDDLRTADQPSGLLVYQTGGVVESRLFDFHGATGIILQVTITVNLPGFAIAGFEVELPWQAHVSWLPDPLEYAGSRRVYRFSVDDKLEFPRDHVLNHNANVRRMIRRGDSLVGCLLGIGSEPIPDQFKHGMAVPAFLIIQDQFWRPYRSSVSFWTDRSERLGDRGQLRVRKGHLLDRPDPRPHSAPAAEEEPEEMPRR